MSYERLDLILSIAFLAIVVIAIRKRAKALREWLFWGMCVPLVLTSMWMIVGAFTEAASQ